jgi:hypothetical protein
MNRRVLLVAGLVTALAAAASAVVALRDDGPGPLRPMPAAELGPGSDLLWGLRVPAGAVMLGRPVPVDRQRTRAYLRVTGDAVRVWAALADQLRSAGHLVYAWPHGEGCDLTYPERPGRTTLEAQAPPPPGTRPTSVTCRLTARPGASAADPGDLRSLEAELRIGTWTRASRRTTLNQLIVTTSTHDRNALPNGPSSPWVEPRDAVIPTPAAGSLPAPGGTFRVSQWSDDEFRVVPGSRLVGLWTGLSGAGDWPSCSGGAFVAVLAVVGDVRRVHDAYAGQVPGWLGSTSHETWPAGSGRVLHTYVRNAGFLSSESMVLDMRSVTDATGDTYAAMEFCRE